jgi:hypothetical protein
MLFRCSDGHKLIVQRGDPAPHGFGTRLLAFPAVDYLVNLYARAALTSVHGG